MDLLLRPSTTSLTHRLCLSVLVCVPPAATGFHLISMKEFLTREGATGGLNPQRMPLPKNNTDLWGRDLWFYLNKVADATPCTSTRIAPPLFAPRLLFSSYYTYQFSFYI